jgi:predicted aminopeptidase
MLNIVGTPAKNLSPYVVQGLWMMASVVCVRCVLVSLVLAVLPGCGTLYLAQAAHGQWQLMRERRPIDAVIVDKRTPGDVRDHLNEVRAAREFASRELALPDNHSYRTYADLHRPFVVWNVVAAPEFSVEPKRWCFPIAGCVAYRGYFSERTARGFASRLHTGGFDVFVGGVPAYSTLGKFADPVLNTMLGYGDTELAAIIFHELAHQLLYVPGDSEFNEAFAVTVEQAGVGRWLKLLGREEELARYRTRAARELESTSLLSRTRRQLAALYAEKLPPEVMRERKRELFVALESDLRALAKQQSVRSPYESWFAEGLNNAHLASVATYFDCVPGFERLLEAHGGDLPQFYAAVRQLARRPRAERHAQLCARVVVAPPS